MLFAGCDIRALAEWLGHKDPGFTLAGLCPHDARRAGQAAAGDQRSLRSHGTTTPQKAGTYDDLPTLQYTL